MVEASRTISSNPATAAAPPCLLVIFGASGDLTKRLLMPALLNLYHEGLLDNDFAILGINRSDPGSHRFASQLMQSVRDILGAPDGEAGGSDLSDKAIAWLEDRISHLSGDITSPDIFDQIKDKTSKLLEGKGHANIVFYLATAPQFFGPCVEGLGRVGLLGQTDHGFRRVIIEKPFGIDLPSAKALNTQILKIVPEDQIYRIDHFLGKETVQNIMVLRFANSIFEPIWNREYIDHIQITAAETVGVEARGKFYDQTGALRDMVPNHMFQLLAMMAMEAPNSFSADAVRSEKAKVIEAVRRLPPEDALKFAVRGQYTSGETGHKPVQGYRQSQNVNPQSDTETYIALKLSIDNWRWAGVPFYIRTGKAMTARKTEVAVQFKKAPGVLFRDLGDDLAPSRMIFRIQPNEGIEIHFSAKHPGRKIRLSDATMNFSYNDWFETSASTGYETLIYDCMIGDATLFQRADNVESGWAVVQPVLDAWASGKSAVNFYEAGSAGPQAAYDLLAADGREWMSL